MSIDIVFDGPPSHESGRFVEVEDEHRRGIRIGEWIERDDGLWALRIPDPREFTRLESENAELRKVRDGLLSLFEEEPEQIGDWGIGYFIPVSALPTEGQESE